MESSPTSAALPGSRVEIVAANVLLLRGAAELVRRIGDRVLTATTPLSPGASVGRHLRHCLDFYDRFLHGIESGRVDYVRRTRDPRVESDRAWAIEQLEGTAAALERLAPGALERSVAVRAEDEDAELETPESWSRSTVHRELQFVRSHTIHHLALVGMLLRSHDVDLPPEFGVAPSTLGHRGPAGR